jgi:hypothetical protein
MTHMALGVRVKKLGVLELVRGEILAALVSVEALAGLEKMDKGRIGS